MLEDMRLPHIQGRKPMHSAGQLKNEFMNSLPKSIIHNLEVAIEYLK